NLTLTPAAGSELENSFNLSVTATASEGGSQATSAAENITVTITPVADAPTLDVSHVNASGNEDGSISLAGIMASAIESDQTLTNITISHVPTNATLNMGQLDSSGNWVISGSDLSNIQNL